MNQPSHYWYLHDHNLFKNLSPRDLEEICFIAKYKKAKRGEIIFFSDENQGRIYTLKSGKVKIVRIDEYGNEQIKDILQKGDLFGQLVQEESSHTNEYAIVLTDQVVFCSFKAADFERFIENKPEVAIKYTKWMGLWFRRMENRYSNIMFKDVRTRMLLFLQDMARQEEEYNAEEIIEVSNYLTHQDISSLICSTRQTVTGLLNQLKSEDIITYDRKRLSINKVKLEQAFL
ncbi:Crp/Fnr family transcriptional regulator [Jiulongibacter sp. NS-SX5]|uniref:Crp/Fnr family transcriptional regulator n=1 Tax=Jiulongibacter sp. NS-SX5 TaxID=3463854 RepID=UPI00405969C9